MTAILFSITAFILGSLPAAKMPELMTEIDKGRDAIQQKEYVAAETTLDAALAAAKAADDGVSAARALFFLGTLKQEQARLATPEGAQQLRRQAIAFYEQSLQFYADSGATLHNLGEVHALNGDMETGRKYLERAIELDEPRRALFAETLGDLEAAAGNHKKAAKAYKKVMKSAAPAPAIRQKYVQASLASGEDAEDLIPHLWLLAKSDRVDLGTSAVMSALQTKEKLDPEAVDALFGILAYGLAKQNYTEGQLYELGLTKQLSELHKNASYQRRIDAIHSVYAGNLDDDELFSSWPDSIRDDDVPEDLSPRRALGELAAARGRRASQDRDYAKAAEFFGRALKLKPGDARLLTDLATVYYAQNRLPEIEPEAEKFEREWKGERATAAELQDRYEFHRVLGTMYSTLGRWTNPAKPQASALHHLEKSVNTAQTIAVRTSLTEAPSFPNEANVTRLLGEAYFRTGRLEESTASRLSAAESYIRIGDILLAREVIASLALSAIDTKEKRKRYGEIVGRMVTFTGLPFVSNLTNSTSSSSSLDVSHDPLIKGALIILETSTDATIRNEASTLLEQRGLRIFGDVLIGGTASESASVGFALTGDG